MTKTLSLVQRVEIASPCPASWAAMTGDDRIRFCSQCKLNVYNLSEMTEEEGERLIIEKEGKLCARIYRRRDGTIITRDCPIGLAALRRRVRSTLCRAAAAVMVIAGVAVTAIRAESRRQPEWWYGQGESPPLFAQTLEVLRRWADTDPPRFIGGAVAMPIAPVVQKVQEIVAPQEQSAPNPTSH